MRKVNPEAIQQTQRTKKVPKNLYDKQLAVEARREKNSQASKVTNYARQLRNNSRTTPQQSQP